MPVANIAQKYYYFDMCLIKSYTQIAMILMMIITFMSLQKKNNSDGNRALEQVRIS